MSGEHNYGPVTMVLRRLRPVALARPIQTHTHFHLAPRLNFTVSHTTVNAMAERVERILVSAAGERILRREQIVQRIFQQGVRREDGRREGVTGTAEVITRAALPPVPAVLLRSAPAVPAVPDVPGPRISESPRPVQQPTPLDVNRLSEQIIQSIDRRLQAHRERIGRR